MRGGGGRGEGRWGRLGRRAVEGRGLGEDSKEGLLGNATKQHVPVTTEGSRLEANRAFFFLALRTKWLPT